MHEENYDILHALDGCCNFKKAFAFKMNKCYFSQFAFPPRGTFGLWQLFGYTTPILSIACHTYQSNNTAICQSVDVDNHGIN